MSSSTNPTVRDVTDRIRERSQGLRSAYLTRLAELRSRDRGSDRMGCANVAHAVAGIPANDKFRVVAERAPNIGIVTAYNDMLSAHAPYQGYPDIIKNEARGLGATAQVAGGVPAMCDGVTQGTPGMELSLFSRDVIAMSTAVALTHDMFDAALMLGVCDKIVPGLLIGALHFGHLPTVFVPAGPMPSGLSNSAKSKVREQAAQGLVGRQGLLDAEMAAYHTVGTCTFYGTANSNQMLLEAMGLHVPGTAFIQPGDAMRETLTREAVRTVLGKAGNAPFDCPPIGEMVDERCIVNAMVALLATGGSTNHLDLETREALTDALAQFEGTLLVVSHDRHLLRATTEQFIIVENGRLREFDGDLDEYKDWLLQTKLAKPAAAASAAPAAGQPAAAEASPVDRKEQKRLEAEQRQRLSAQRKPLENRLKKVEAAMAQRSEQKATIDAALADPAIYEAENKPKLKTLLADQVECSKELEQLEGEWLELQEQLEALAA